MNTAVDHQEIAAIRARVLSLSIQADARLTAIDDMRHETQNLRQALVFILDWCDRVAPMTVSEPQAI